MNGLTFVHPAWFWAFFVLPLLFGLRFWAHVRTARRLPGLVSPRLGHRLINGASHAKRWTVFILQWFALACVVTALARPQWGFEETESEIDARNLLIAIDTSRSMLSDDLPPNRLSRAKLAAKDIILSLPEDRIGLIAFAGKPFLQAPFTVDHEAVLEAVDQLDTEIIPRGGTNLSAAVSLALETIEEAKIGRSALILFSDGEALEGLAEVAKVREQATKLGLSLIAVGVGTSGGSIIPELDESGNPIPGVFVKDEQGQVVRTRLTPEALQELARDSGGYLQLGGGASLANVVDQIRKQLSSTREESDTKRIPIERFLWPLGAAAILFALSHLVPLFWLKPLPARRFAPSAARAAMLLFAMVPCGLHARDPLAGGQDAFVRNDFQSALSAYEGSLGEKWSSRALNRLQLGIGAAAYRLNDYERAAEAYGAVAANGTEEQRAQALYNLGNTLYRRGELALSPPGATKPDADAMQPATPQSPTADTMRDWQTAIEHYEASLAIEPDNAKTSHNLEFVKKRLEELKQQEEEKKQEQEKQDEQKQDQKEEGKKEEENKDQQNQDQQQKEDQQSQQDQQQNQDQDQNQEEKQDQQNQDSKQDQNQDPRDSQDPSDSDSRQDPKDPQSGNEPKDQPDSPQPRPGDMPPPAEEPKDGDLQADPNQNQPQPANPSQQATPADLKPNPQTGYSASEARQLLESLADETEVRPLIQPSRGEVFKNW